MRSAACDSAKRATTLAMVESSFVERNLQYFYRRGAARTARHARRAVLATRAGVGEILSWLPGAATQRLWLQPSSLCASGSDTSSCGQSREAARRGRGCHCTFQERAGYESLGLHPEATAANFLQSGRRSGAAFEDARGNR